MILQLLDSNNNIQKLILDSTKVTSCVVMEIVKTTNKSLELLDLQNCSIDNAGAKSLARFLASANCNLKELRLQGNPNLTDSALNYFVKVLGNNLTLKPGGLILDYGKFDILSLTEMFNANHPCIPATGMVLNISGEEDSIDKFTQSLAYNKYVKDIRLGQSSGPIKIHALKETLKETVDSKIGSADNFIELQIRLCILKQNKGLNEIKFVFNKDNDSGDKNTMTFAHDKNLDEIIRFLNYRVVNFPEAENLQRLILDQHELSDQQRANLYSTHHISLR